MMELVEYSLISIPDTTVKVPKAYDDKARKLINALADNQTIISLVPEHPYLSNPGILARARSLTETDDEEKSKMLKDLLYLRIAIHGNEKIVHGAKDTNAWIAASEIDSTLIDLVGTLEDRML